LAEHENNLGALSRNAPRGCGRVAVDGDSFVPLNTRE